MSTVGARLTAILLGAALLAPAGCASARPDGVRDAPGGTARAEPSPSAAATKVAPARRARSVLEPEAPERATLPSGAVVRVRPAGTDRGLLAVPDDVRIAGWWEGGSRVGDPFGSMLVAAHVDSSTRGLGPFAELLTTVRGERVVVRTAHLAQEFRVTSRRLVPQGPLTDEEWLFSAAGAHRLTLVTCAPPYDRERGGYQNLAVVVATPVGPPTARGAR